MKKLSECVGIGVGSGWARWGGAILHNGVIVLFLHYNYPLCNIALGRFERLEAVVFLVGGDKLIKKGFFVCEGLGKQKAFFYGLVAWEKQRL